jgi:hypothetical protein
VGVLRELARRYAFGDLAALARAGLIPGNHEAEIIGLGEFGQQLMELDAEDFGVAASTVPKTLVNRAKKARMPQEPKEFPRGALDSLRPAYALLLEVMAVRWLRNEMAPLVAAAHVAAEYLPVLAWEPVLGHAADPARLGRTMKVKGSWFGVVQPEGPKVCDHTRGITAACARSLRVAGEPGEGWRAYLDRQHSQVSHGLGVCASACRTPCTIISGLDPAVRAGLTARCRLARDFSDGAFVKLRHAAPVGHGFGVPSREEVENAWARSHTSLRHHQILRDQPGSADHPIPGLPATFSAVAGAPIVPSTVLRDVSVLLTTLLPG